MLTQIGVFLVDTVAGFFVFVLLARFHFQWLRVPFRNPVGEFVLATTSWMVAPARRVVPGLAGLDLATLLLAFIVQMLLNFVRPRRLGLVLTTDGTLKILPGLVRLPDACFIPRDRLPGGKRPKEPIPGLVPDLAVEVLSKGNTRAEMARKLREYFEAGTRLVWMVDPKARTVRVHTGPTTRQSTVLKLGDTLDGGDVLPGFAVPVADLFPNDEP